MKRTEIKWRSEGRRRGRGGEIKWENVVKKTKQQRVDEEKRPRGMEAETRSSREVCHHMRSTLSSTSKSYVHIQYTEAQVIQSYYIYFICSFHRQPDSLTDRSVLCKANSSATHISTLSEREAYTAFRVETKTWFEQNWLCIDKLNTPWVFPPPQCQHKS